MSEQLEILSGAGGAKASGEGGNGKTFEENMARLEALVSQLERGELSLEDALTCYKEGVELVGFCQKSLARATHEVELLTGEGKGE